MSEEQVLHFWFNELTPQQWFIKDKKLDLMIKERFINLHQMATQGELYQWRKTAKGRLAEVIILDQFSRNIFRENEKSFLYDAMALILSQECVQLKLDEELNTIERSFLYMPYMHSESAKIHTIAVKLFNIPGLENQLEYEYKHKEIIDQFGRYPHRNKILNRKSTLEEVEFLKQDGSSF